MGFLSKVATLLPLLALAGCPNAAGKSEASKHPLARKPAPAVSVRLEKGGEFTPDDAKGKVLVVDFWATWCGPCKASFPRVDAIYKKHKSKGLEVVAINEDDDLKKVPEFLADTKVTFTIAFDHDGKAAETYGVQTMPSSFLVDRRGVVRYAHSGYHPDDAGQIEAEIEELLNEE